MAVYRVMYTVVYTACTPPVHGRVQTALTMQFVCIFVHIC